MWRRFLQASLPAVVLLGIAVVVLQEKRLRDRIAALDAARVRSHSNDAFDILYSAAPEYFAQDMQMDREVSAAFLPLYRSLDVPDQWWQTDILNAGVSLGSPTSWCFVSSQLRQRWKRQINQKLGEPGVAEYLSEGSGPAPLVAKRLDLILRLPNPETALWAATLLQRINMLPKYYRQVLETHLDDKYCGDDVAKFLSEPR